MLLLSVVSGLGNLPDSEAEAEALRLWAQANAQDSHTLLDAPIRRVQRPVISHWSWVSIYLNDVMVDWLFGQDLQDREPTRCASPRRTRPRSSAGRRAELHTGGAPPRSAARLRYADASPRRRRPATEAERMPRRVAISGREGGSGANRGSSLVLSGATPQRAS